uniref:HNH endonuclease n=1 Tax=Candidatus Kentrum sp. LFY TaxID=2126342 RepID=A0A450WD62_9GAMM|nr:MAG: HNH endonuclease [Candidatus Kentron sp. LFY]
MSGRHWKDAEIEILKARYPHSSTAEVARLVKRKRRAVYQKARALGITKSDAYREKLYAELSLRLTESGRKTRFQPGLSPWNRGMNGLVISDNSRTTWFPPGHRPKNWVPIGTQIVDSYGYLRRKVRDDAPLGLSRRNWVHVHVSIWTERHGPVPAGHAVVFKNGDKTDIRIGNLELVSRTELMRRNTIHRYPEDVQRAIRSLGRLNRVIRENTEIQP